jgi:hypothetical protein
MAKGGGTHLDMVQHGHRHRGDHGDLLVVVLEDEDHVEVLQAELYALEMDELDILERADEWRPGGEVHQRAGGRLQQHRLTVGHALGTQRHISSFPDPNPNPDPPDLHVLGFTDPDPSIIKQK